MSQFEFDLLVIGAGSGGVRAARTAAALGKRVAIVEQRFFGGTCVNIGCVPKKLLVYAADFSEHFEAAAGYGWQVATPKFDWPTLIQHKNQEIQRLQGIYAKLLKDSGVTIIEGHACMQDAHTVKVAERSLQAERILIATGSHAKVPDIAGKELGLISDDMFYLKTLPASIAIIGAGYIGVEFACILQRLGVKVTLIDKYDLPLNGLDEEARKLIAQQMQHQGIQILPQQKLYQIQAIGQQRQLTINQEQQLQVDAVLFATGRSANTSGLGLENIGIALEQDGRIKVNTQMQTNVSNIYAIGDVASNQQLTPVALADAMSLINTLYGDGCLQSRKRLTPTAIFSHPEYACVGVTEAQAKATYGDDLSIFTSAFKPMKHTLTGMAERTWMKLIVQRSTDLVVGAHMVGESAAEIIQGIAVAINAGAKKVDFDSTLGIHPTAAEEFVTMRQATR